MRRVGLKRVYEAAAKEDGKRYLVERLWPRGVSKEKADLTDWLKDVAPSPALRAWYSHDQSRWEGFRRRYVDELEKIPAAAAAVATLREESRKGPVTLVFAARDPQLSSARILKEYLEARPKKRS